MPMMTVEISRGQVVAFVGMDNEGNELETCKTSKWMEAKDSRTWNLSNQEYEKVRDVLCFIIKHEVGASNEQSNDRLDDWRGSVPPHQREP